MMNSRDNRDPTAEAERSLAAFGPTPAEATFICEQAKAIDSTVLNRFTSNRGDMRPATFEMAFAYPLYLAADWENRPIQEETPEA
jgi:hypothetical protein